MHRKLAILFFLFPLVCTSCIVGQLKYDRKVQSHMETLLTNPDENILSIIEEWNATPDLKKGLIVDLELVQEYVFKLEFNNKRGECTAHYKPGLDYESERKLMGHVMVVFGGLYWQIPEQKRETIFLKCMREDIETLVFSWTRNDPQPGIANDRLLSFM